MDDLNLEKTSEGKSGNIEKLIQIEWAVIHAFLMKLKDPELTLVEWTKAADSLGYHMSHLNKMLNQKGVITQFNEQNLGEFIRDLEPKTLRLIKRDFKKWTRRLSLKRY